MKHKPGDFVNIYTDPMQGFGYEGKAELIKLIFTNKESSLEYWNIRFHFDKKEAKKFILKKGLKPKINLIERAGIII